MKSIKISLDIKPLSVNKAFQGRRFKTQDYKQYEWDIAYNINSKYRNLFPGKEMLKISYHFYVKNFLNCDGGNFEKCLTDCLVKSDVITDDRYISEYHIYKHKSEKDYIEIIVEQIE